MEHENVLPPEVVANPKVASNWCQELDLKSDLVV